MAEELSAVLTLRADTRETVEKGVQEMNEILGVPSKFAQALIPMPANWIKADGSFSGEAVDWAYKHWGCKGCWLEGDLWWEETEPGDESNEWRACWDLTSVNGIPRPLIEALSKRLPYLQVAYYLQKDDDDDYEIIFADGEIDSEDGSADDEEDDDDDDNDEDEEDDDNDD
jgi:hypothetical protein